MRAEFSALLSVTWPFRNHSIIIYYSSIILINAEHICAA